MQVFDAHESSGCPVPHHQYGDRGQADELVEWRHPVGHLWRWQFEALSPTTARVTETFDYHDAGKIKNAIGYYHLIGATKFNATGIESTLSKLQSRYAQRPRNRG